MTESVVRGAEVVDGEIAGAAAEEVGMIVEAGTLTVEARDDLVDLLCTGIPEIEVIFAQLREISIHTHQAAVVAEEAHHVADAPLQPRQLNLLAVLEVGLRDDGGRVPTLDRRVRQEDSRPSVDHDLQLDEGVAEIGVQAGVQGGGLTRHQFLDLAHPLEREDAQKLTVSVARPLQSQEEADAMPLQFLDRHHRA